MGDVAEIVSDHVRQRDLRQLSRPRPDGKKEMPAEKIDLDAVPRRCWCIGHRGCGWKRRHSPFNRRYNALLQHRGNEFSIKF
jgi:hypothetical protein